MMSHWTSQTIMPSQNPIDSGARLRNYPTGIRFPLQPPRRSTQPSRMVCTSPRSAAAASHPGSVSPAGWTPIRRRGSVQAWRFPRRPRRRARRCRSEPRGGASRAPASPGPAPGVTQRMPEGDRSTVHVDPLWVQPQLVDADAHLRCECLIDLEEADVVQGQAGLGKHLAHRRDRPDGEQRGIHADRCGGHDLTEGLPCPGFRRRPGRPGRARWPRPRQARHCRP